MKYVIWQVVYAASVLKVCICFCGLESLERSILTYLLFQGTNWLDICLMQAPYIEHGKVLLSDSTFILRYLENTYAGKLKVKTHTDPLKRGIAVAVQRLCEDHLTYGVVWHRWFDNEVWQEISVLLMIFISCIFFELLFSQFCSNSN